MRSCNVFFCFFWGLFFSPEIVADAVEKAHLIYEHCSLLLLPPKNATLKCNTNRSANITVSFWGCPVEQRRLDDGIVDKKKRISR
jgi:hypothetical protein